MSQYLLAIICFIAYLIIYYLFGVVTSKIFKLENEPIHQMIYGMFVYGCVFFLYVIPLKFKVVPADIIGKIWFSVVAVFCVLTIVLLRKRIAEGWKSLAKSFKDNKIVGILVSLFTIFQIAYTELFGRLVGGFNQVYFVGWVSNGVLHNELMTYDVGDGLARQLFDNQRYLCTFMDHSVLTCKLFGINPMVEVRTVLVAVFMLVECILAWWIASQFGKGDQIKSLIAFGIYWIAKNLLVGSVLLPTYYAYYRNYEGKGFVANMPIPLLVLLMWKMYDNPKDRGLLWKSCFVLFGSMTYSLSMMFTYPFIVAAYAPFLIAKKDWRLVRNMAVLVFICGIFFVLFYMGWKGIFLDLTIKRGG